MSQDDDTPRPRGLRDNWWWSGGLWSVGGAVIVWYQWPALTGQLDEVPSTAALVAVWVMAVIGAGIGVVGLRRLWRDWQVEKARREAEQQGETNP